MDKSVKRIARELKRIRVELEKMNGVYTGKMHITENNSESLASGDSVIMGNPDFNPKEMERYGEVRKKQLMQKHR